MNQILKASNYALLTVALFLAVGAVAAGSNPVLAQYPCTAQVSYPVTATQQYYASYSNAWNIRLTMPVSGSCMFAGSQLYAVGNAYDTVLNSNVGSANTVLAPVNGGYFNGQLVFYFSPAVLGHPLQIWISIYNSGAYGYYNGQYGALVATISQTITIHPGYYQSNYYYQNVYGYHNRSCSFNRYRSYYRGMYYHYHYGDCDYDRR